MNDIIQSILSRRSTRAYKSEELKKEDLNLILEAGTYAPSSINQQPWHFTVVQNKEVLNKVNEGCRNIIRNLPNKEFAKRAEDPNFSVFYNAPILVVVSGNLKAISPQVDCALALHNMHLAAKSLNIGSCWINAVSQYLNTDEGNSIKNELQIPEGYTPMYSGVFGYSAMGSPKTPPRKENVVTMI
jgi:nitroreductase